MIRLDAAAGTLEALVDADEWSAREPADRRPRRATNSALGRELFAAFRATCRAGRNAAPASIAFGGASHEPSSEDASADRSPTAPVIPVIVLEDAAHAVPLARALVAGGAAGDRDHAADRRRAGARSRRSPARSRARSSAPARCSATGSCATPRKAGARFAVSPGRQADAARRGGRDSPVPLLPGAATATEVMPLLERATRSRNSSPPEPAGGIADLKALASPLPAVSFCPTGGIDAEERRDYLALPNVVCVGGSWVTPKDAIRPATGRGSNARARGRDAREAAA